jgi:hypothetical protein
MLEFLKRVPHWGIVRQALDFTWRHKQLWLLGVFAILADVGGAFEVVLKALPLGDHVGGLLAWDGWFNQLIPLAGLWSSAFEAAAIGSAAGLLASFITTGIIVVATGVVLFTVVLAIASLVKAVGCAEDGHTATFAESARHGLKKGWGVFTVLAAMQLLLGLSLGIAAMSLQWVISAESFVSALAFSMALGTYIIVAIAATIIAILALNEHVMGDRPLLEAVIWAWGRLRRHWLAALELALFVLVVGAAVFLVALTVLLVVGVVIIMLTALSAWLKLSAATVTLMVITNIAIYAVAIVAAGFVGVFQVAVWHLFWQRLGHRTFLGWLYNWMHRALGKRG